MKRRLEALFAVEAAVVMGVALICLMLLLFLGFYLHDQNILLGALNESAQIGREMERAEEDDLALVCFRERIEGKMLYFDGADCSLTRGSEEIRLTASAQSRRMKLSVSALAALTEPEKEIRRLAIEREE